MGYFENRDMEQINDSIRNGFEFVEEILKYFGQEILVQLKSVGAQLEEVKDEIKKVRK